MNKFYGECILTVNITSHNFVDSVFVNYRINDALVFDHVDFVHQSIDVNPMICRSFDVIYSDKLSEIDIMLIIGFYKIMTFAGNDNYLGSLIPKINLNGLPIGEVVYSITFNSCKVSMTNDLLGPTVRCESIY
jgi:hypothetical protein